MSILNEIKTSSDLEEKQNNNNATAFNRLLELQLLIQKHSGLKELCKKINFIIFIYSY